MAQGAGAAATGRLAEDRIAAALVVLRRFAAEAKKLGATRLLGVATEATRAAANGPEFLARVRELGWDVRVIGGDEEAALSFRGLAATTDVSGSLVVGDIGGGSTEVIVAEGGVPRAARSVRLGSGTLTDRHVAADPPTPEELRDCRVAAAEALASLVLPRGPETRLVAVGGTGEYLARLVPGAAGPGGSGIGPAAVEEVLERLTRVSAAELAGTLGIPEARARVLPAGVAIVAALADRVLPGRIETARSGIRTGLLLEALDGVLSAER